MQWDDESKLIQALQQQQTSAYKFFIRTYQHAIYQVCMRMMQDSSEAEDMTQETLIRIVRSINNFKGQSSLKTWVYRIAINLCKNRLQYLKRREQKNHKAISSFEGDYWQEQISLSMNSPRSSSDSTLASPHQNLVAKETQTQIEQALHSIDSSLRELLILRDIQGLSYQEITDITDLALGTVKSRIHRARLLFIQAYKKIENVPIPPSDKESS